MALGPYKKVLVLVPEEVVYRQAWAVAWEQNMFALLVLVLEQNMMALLGLV